MKEDKHKNDLPPIQLDGELEIIESLDDSAPDVKGNPKKAVSFFKEKLEFFKDKYNPADLMGKISEVAKKTGVTTVYYVLLLYYAIMSDKVPAKKKLLVAAALGYFISPLDFIPDFIIGGFIDDASILLFAVKSIASFITDDIKQKAKDKLKDWFGEQEIMEIKIPKDSPLLSPFILKKILPRLKR